MQDFYENFNANKKRHHLNNKKIGEVVELKPDALRMAIKNQSLSKLQINAINELFNEKKPQIIDKEFIDSLFKNPYFIKKLKQVTVNKKENKNH